MRTYFLTFLFLLLFGFWGFAQPAPEYDTTIDVLAYKLDLNLLNNFKSKKERAFEATESVSFIIKSVREDSTVWFHASDKTIEIRLILGATVIRKENDKIYLKPTDIFSPGDTVIINFEYSHTGQEDQAFFVSKGSVFTNNSPSEARSWFICKDHPSDKALFSISLAVPPDVTVGAVGMMTALEDSLSGKKWTWESSYPMATYLMVFSASSDYGVTRLTVKSKVTGKSIPIQLYWRKSEDKEAINYIYKMVPYMIDWFEQRFGPYPFEKVAFATLTSDFLYGGMENQGFITLCSNCWYDLLVVHEFAHQWFGDLITPSNWKDIWLNEGFAEYMEALWAEDLTEDRKFYTDMMKDFADVYFRSKPEDAICEPKWDYSDLDGLDFYKSELIYKKAACVLHIFREEVTKPVFMEILKRYTANENIKYGNATTDTLIQVVNEVTGKDYTWFFNQWLNYPKHPVYKNKFEFKKENGEDYLFATIAQTDRPEIYYQATIELKINYKDGTSEVQSVFNSENGQLFKIKVKPGAKSVEFDPENKIILKEVK